MVRVEVAAKRNSVTMAVGMRADVLLSSSLRRAPSRDSSVGQR